MSETSAQDQNLTSELNVEEKMRRESGLQVMCHGYWDNARVVQPCAFACELSDSKFYVAITHNLNETVARMKTSSAPIFIRQHRLKKVMEVEINGSLHALREMALRYMVNKGPENVRSSYPGHLNSNSLPGFYTEFLSLASNANPPLLSDENSSV